MDIDTNVSTTDRPYVTALEYAQAHNLSKQWVLKLARDGRFEGAYRAGICWLIPRDEPLPEARRPGPKPKPSSGVIVKNFAKWNEDFFERNKNAPPQYVSEEERHTFNRRMQGCKQVFMAWKKDDTWIGPVWLPNMSKEEFQAREEEFRAWDDSDYALPRPDWMPLDE